MSHVYLFKLQVLAKLVKLQTVSVLIFKMIFIVLKKKLPISHKNFMTKTMIFCLLITIVFQLLLLSFCNVVRLFKKLCLFQFFRKCLFINHKKFVSNLLGNSEKSEEWRTKQLFHSTFKFLVFPLLMSTDSFCYCYKKLSELADPKNYLMF